MTAIVAAEAMRLGIGDADPTIEVDLCPVSDGGEGFRGTLEKALHGTTTGHDATGPLGSPVRAGVTILPASADEPRTAVLEMAEAAGLERVPSDRRDPECTTTCGVGELVRHALDAGARRILIGLGGSATVDGGIGLAEALGYRFLDHEERRLQGPLSGRHLDRIGRIDSESVDARLRDTEVLAACDVASPLLGPGGAATVYGPQKGATAAQVARLEAGLSRLTDLWQRDLGVDIAETPGAGAAGGLGAGVMAFLFGDLRRGIDIVLDAVRFDDRLRRADLCLTGEGRIDAQTLSGKAVLGVARAARARGVPTVVLAGRIEEDARARLANEFAKPRAFGQDLPLETAMARGPELLRAATRSAVGI